MSNSIQGSVAQLAGRITVNGVALGQPELSMLTRIGRGHFCKPIKVIKHEGKRGKPTTIWEFDADAMLNFRFANAVAAEAVANGEDVEGAGESGEGEQESNAPTSETGTDPVEESNEPAELTASTEL